MKTYNIKFEDFSALKQFIESKKLNNENNILLQIFTGVCEVGYIAQLVKNIKELIPQIKIIGTTTSGEILEGAVYKESTILSFSVFKNTIVKTYYVEHNDDSYLMGKRLIEKFSKDNNAKVAITFTDGLRTNGEEYIKSFEDFDKNLVVAGGLAGDNSSFIDTIVFTQDKIKDNGAVVAILINNELIVNTKASFGWESIGKTMVITQSHKNRVYEIDGVKALDIYRKYLGDDIAKLLPKTGIEFPLIVKKGVLRIPRAVVGREDDGSLLFAGNLKIGDRVTLGYGNVDSILGYSDSIAKDCICTSTESIFIYSCMARLALMQDCIAKEMQTLSEFATLSGFFTYGEFYSDVNINHKEMLNQTMTILSLSENAEREKRYIPSVANEEPKTNLTLKALSTLISQTTKELEETNRELKRQVANEIKDNFNKNKLLKKQSRMAQMGQMLSVIAHQWRQPLSAISSTILSIQVKLNKNKFNFNNKEDREEFLNFLKQKHDDIFFYLDSLSETIDDFRNFFKTKKEKDRVLLTEPIDMALSILKNSIKNKGIKIEIEYNVNDEIKIYKNEMMHVVLNILKNAKDNFIDKNIKNPTISIKTWKGPKYYIIQICDNGGGISKDILPNIFNLYYSTKDNKNGTGLGLYVSKIIVEEHNSGKLSVKNMRNGVCFFIKLPRHILES